jgi:putative transposase
VALEPFKRSPRRCTASAQLISPELESRLYPFLAGILQDLACAPIAINGMPDHVHLLACFPSKLSISDMLRHVKNRSSGWIHDNFPELAAFAWQDHGGFTVSTSMVPRVKAYILVRRNTTRRRTTGRSSSRCSGRTESIR